MAENKHQKLANQLHIMKQEINEHVESVKADILKYNLYQLFFYGSESSILVKSPYKLKNMINSYCTGLANLAPNFQIKEMFKKQLILPPKVYLHNDVWVKETTKIYAGCFNERSISIWTVKMTLFHQTNKNIRNLFLETFLYCPIPNEYSNCRQWLELNENLTLDETIVRTQKEAVKEDKLIKNLKKPSYEYFIKCLNKHLSYLEKEKEFSEKKFVPEINENILNSYRRVLILIKSRTSRHYYEFLNIWKNELIKIIFENVDWSASKISKFLLYFDQTLLGNIPRIDPLKKSRWENGQAIDQVTASAIIFYFTNFFIENPSKKIYGQLACFLWTLVWLAHETQDKTPTLNDIINMTTKNMLPNERHIIISDINVTISEGLMNLYKILRGEGKSINSCRLFPDLTLKNIRNCFKSLPSVFKRSSEILPETFLYFPHPNQNQRVSPSMLKIMRNKDNDTAMKMLTSSIVYQVEKNKKCS